MSSRSAWTTQRGGCFNLNSDNDNRSSSNNKPERHLSLTYRIETTVQRWTMAYRAEYGNKHPQNRSTTMLLRLLPHFHRFCRQRGQGLRHKLCHLSGSRPLPCHMFLFVAGGSLGSFPQGKRAGTNPFSKLPSFWPFPLSSLVPLLKLWQRSSKAIGQIAWRLVGA